MSGDMLIVQVYKIELTSGDSIDSMKGIAGVFTPMPIGRYKLHEGIV